MVYYLVVQIAAMVLAAALFSAAVYYCFRYRRLKRLYRADYARTSCIRSISRLLPLMPRYNSKRYRNAEALIIDSGLKVSVEGFYMAKTLLFILGFVFFISIETTNAFLLHDRIVGDMNMGMTLLEQSNKKADGSLWLEREMFRYFNASMTGAEYTLEKLENRKNYRIYLRHIEEEIRSRWSGLEESADITAQRLYKKLLKIRGLEKDYTVYLTAILASVFLYFIPDIAAALKLKLIEDKRDWEILNCIYVFSIFGRLPPFNIKSVLSNILLASDIYKPVMTEALNNVKSGKGEAAFDRLLQKVDNEELFELLEAMRLSMSTGLLDMADNIDEMAANQLKWLDIKSIKRRKAKQVMAMLPVVLIMLLAMVYFSYSLSTLSNPMSFIK
ncbi:MAG TPA: hypothetical protein VN580_05420 [Clostridia bacterium]|nr:hypothetical protein [Clostridia bacterium]